MADDGTLYYTTLMDAAKQNQLMKRDAATGQETLIAQNIGDFIVNQNKIFYEELYEPVKIGNDIYLKEVPVFEMSLSGTNKRQRGTIIGKLEGSMLLDIIQ